MRLLESVPLLKSAVDQVVEAKPPELPSDRPSAILVLACLVLALVLLLCFTSRKEVFDPEAGCYTQSFDEVVPGYKPTPFSELAEGHKASERAEDRSMPAVKLVQPCLAEGD